MSLLWGGRRRHRRGRGPGHPVAQSLGDLTANVTVAVVSDGNGSTYEFGLPDGTTVSGIERLYLTTGSADDQATFTTLVPGYQEWSAGAGTDSAVLTTRRLPAR